MLFAGMIMAPAFLFQQNLAIQWIQVLLFISLSIISGKKFRLLPNLFMFLGITAANLIIPIGKVLFYVLQFPLTDGALNNGLSRSALLIGMIYLSRFSVRKGLSLPGRMGSMMSLVFFYFDKIVEGEKITKGNIMKKIDDKLLAIQAIADESLQNGLQNFGAADENGRFFNSYAFLLILIFLNWGLLLLSRLHFA